MQSIDLLTCPVCGTPIQLNKNMLLCLHGHTFDLAKEGYVNLLRKKLTGDTKEMVLARRHFFDLGYYLPLSETLNELVFLSLSEAVFHLPSLHILDAGCGEGYYLGNLREYLVNRGQSVLSVGIDISKDAIRMAAKRYKEMLFVVANLKERLVLMDQSFHVMLNIFAPRNVEEYARVLAPSGLLLVVIPGPSHLRQLRSSLKLLAIEENKQQNVIAQFADRFELITTRDLTYDLHLSQPEIEQVVMMTPNYWHMSDEMRFQLSQMHETTTTIDFTCLLFRLR